MGESGTGWWIADLWQGGQTVLLVSWIFWVITSICLHELGHGFAAIREGDDTPRRTGHMTINPMVHMGGMSMLAFILIGFAWGLMPVNPYNFKNGRMGDAIVAFAGPLVNLILVVVLLTAAGLWAGLVTGKPDSAQWADNVGTFLYTGGWLNLVLFGFNLLPVPPLDGSRILAAFSNGYARLLMKPNFQAIGLGVLILVFWVTPLGGLFFNATKVVAVYWEALVASWVS